MPRIGPKEKGGEQILFRKERKKMKVKMMLQYLVGIISARAERPAEDGPRTWNGQGLGILLVDDQRQLLLNVRALRRPDLDAAEKQQKQEQQHKEDARDAQILPVMDFMKACHMCRRLLSPHQDIHMYKGDQAFCSEQCRWRQIIIDESKEKPRRRASARRTLPRKPATNASETETKMTLVSAR